MKAEELYAKSGRLSFRDKLWLTERLTADLLAVPVVDLVHEAIEAGGAPSSTSGPEARIDFERESPLKRLEFLRRTIELLPNRDRAPGP